MSLAIGIVGLPNVGKSTLFNALLKQQAALAANYPFATIEPNVGVVPVPDPRLEVLAKIVKTSVIKPATVEFVDIAGLVKGASEGEGLGNKFLSHIRQTAIVAHVVRAFSDPDVIREGSVSPVEDLSTIRTELQLADLATLVKQPEPKGAVEKEVLEKAKIVKDFIEWLNQGRVLNQHQALADRNSLASRVAAELCLLSAKPELFVVNVDESVLTAGPYQQLINKFALEMGVPEQSVIVICAQIESELASLSNEDQELYLKDLGLDEPGLNRLIARAYQVLNLQSFLTAGELEVKAWTIPALTRAQDAAGVIHTDFAKKFIKAHVADYQTFVELDGWKGVREQGKMRQEGRDYLMRPDDIVEFMIGK